MPRIAVFVAICAICLTSNAWGQVWRNGEMPQLARSQAELGASLERWKSASEPGHIVVRFAEAPTEEDRADLGRAGLTLLDYLGEHAYFAAVAPQRLRPAAVLGESLVDLRPVDRAWKTHPLLAQEAPAYAIVDVSDPADPIVATYLLFHRDVSAAAEGVNLLAAHNGLVIQVLQTVNGIVAEVPWSAVDDLADADIVQWIEPALPPMDALNNSNRVRTQAEDLQAAPYDLDGSGVNVLVYDAGIARSTHPDFEGRLTSYDNSGISNHATHVSGTIGGAGTLSGGTYRGMAPAVTLISYGFEWGGGGTFLYSNPGDIEDDYAAAIQFHGATISNNSIGTNTASNGFPCEITGDYGVTASVIDSIVHGGLGAPFRVVWANGNERGTNRCGNSYFSTAPPACAKNQLAIGALNSNNDTMTGFSSWGPTDDGRLKPDLCAPGCQSNDDWAVTSTTSIIENQYTGMCGTSMASPTATGVCALILQDYHVQFPGTPDPRNATLKALLAQTAVDLGNDGPDYKFGFGSIRGKDAIDFMRTGQILESEMTQGHAVSYLMDVPPGMAELKATIAWDDPPATPNVDTALINDLDILLIDPQGSAHHPWVLDPDNPSDPAARSGADHRNNIEQVYVENPAAGNWWIEIHGYNIPEGPQVFTLVHPLPITLDCGQNGLADECDLSCGEPGGVCDVPGCGNSSDCNLNAIPDECEPDCNANAVPDVCDIADNIEDDANLNTVPDNCEVRVYVNATANGADDGTSWNDAYRELPTALADPVLSNGGTVWVAAGVYHPAQPGGDRFASFVLPDNVALVGGFAGTESTLIDRDLAGNPVILSGDLDGDDTPGFGNVSDNSYHVVTASGTSRNAVLQDLTITGGNADGADFPDVFGGGLYAFEGEPTLRGVTFMRNRAVLWGGGAYFEGEAAPAIVSCRFLANFSLRDGGAIATRFSDVQIIDTLFTGNEAAFAGGGLFGLSAEPAVSNSTFSGNVAGQGGGMQSTAGMITLANSVLWGNTDNSGSGEVAQVGNNPPIAYRNCIAGLTGLAGNGNIDADPLFRDADGADDIIGTADDDLRLASGSPCIDAGDNTRVAPDAADLNTDTNLLERTPRDIAGNDRFLDVAAVPDTGVSDPPAYVAVVDMGAYEASVVSCEGDLDGNGQVDPFDLNIVLSRFGCPVGSGDPECDAADLDGDGVVNPFDSNLVLSLFGPCG